MKRGLAVQLCQDGLFGFKLEVKGWSGAAMSDGGDG